MTMLNPTNWINLPITVTHNTHWFIVSDTHGFYDQMVALVENAPKGSQILHLGDIGDRGPDSYKCFEYLYHHPEIKLIFGNHDLFIKQAIIPSPLSVAVQYLWNINGGSEFIKSIADNSERIQLIFSVLERQVAWIWDGDILFTHAGLLKDEVLIEKPHELYITEEQYSAGSIPNHITWIDRKEFLGYDETVIYSQFQKQPFIVHGHSKEFELIHKHRLNVDYKNHLVALEIYNNRFRYYGI